MKCDFFVVVVTCQGFSFFFFFSSGNEIGLLPEVKRWKHSDSVLDVFIYNPCNDAEKSPKKHSVSAFHQGNLKKKKLNSLI